MAQDRFGPRTGGGSKTPARARGAHPRRDSETGWDTTSILEAIVQGSVGLTARVIASTAPELTLVQWRALLVIGDAVDGVSVAVVSHRIGATSSATSRLISRMALRGLVETRKAAPDRRVTTVLLSRKGAQLRGRIVQTRRLLLGSIAARIEDPASIEQLALAFTEFD